MDANSTSTSIPHKLFDTACLDIFQMGSCRVHDTNTGARTHVYSQARGARGHERNVNRNKTLPHAHAKHLL